ncbi:MAG: hypothetical protein JNK32_09785 [Anaerolineales bacterium]|nr:hypothetical protein [Anaerolineales bacterium]
MDIIKFVIEQYVDEEGGYRFPVINIYINNSNLIDLVTKIEKKDWDGDIKTRSSYIGFEVPRFGQFRNEMLGRKIYARSVLLTCTCTIELCDSITADMIFDEQTVTWSGLNSPWLSGKTYSPFVSEEEALSEGWKPLDYSGLGPFTFDLAQYLSALERVTHEWRSWYS